MPPVPTQYLRQPVGKPPTYKHRAVIEDGVDAQEIVERIFGGEVKLTQKELLVLAPKLHAVTKDIISNKHVIADITGDSAEPLCDKPERPCESVSKSIEVSSLEGLQPIKKTLVSSGDRQSTSVWTISDPIVEYLAALEPEERVGQVFSISTEQDKEAADKMSPLRVLPAVINGVGEEEALLNSISQIFSMSQFAAADCKVTWDPALSINMQSANGGITKTCGLTRNIPFTFGNVTVLLQVHVMEYAPYQVLLGRLFDTVTKSQVTNDQEDNQFINITCPNTGNRVSLPTYQRGQLP
jgi:hypothetical protein